MTAITSSAVQERLDADREGLAGVLIDDVAELDPAAVGCLIELEVHGPDLVGSGSLSTGLLARRLAAALAGPHGASEALLAPDPSGALTVDRPALPQQDLVSCLPAPPRVLFGDLPQPAGQTLILSAWWLWLLALRGAVLARDTARSAL